MAELLAKWLNEEVGLSKKVTDFENDFASGYLFGELLYKFNQQSDFQNFSTKNATSHFVMNFEKLEPTLRSLRVKFNSKTVEQIMSRERGESLRLLYQLKMCLEKVYPPADISIVAKTGTFGDNQPAQRIAQSKPKYDEVTHNFFKQRVGKLNRAQKDIDLEAHLQKFDDEMQAQAAQAAKLDNKDVVDDAQKKQEMRRIQINKLQRNAGFMEEWLAKGVEDWKVNMNVKREREATQLEFDFTQADKYNKHAQKKLQEAQDEVTEGIKDFEKNLKAQGIKTKVTKEEADRAVTDTLNGKPWQGSTINSATQKAEATFTKTFDAKVSTKKGNFTLTSTGLKHRTKKTVTENQRQEREKRRRRLINHQSTLLVDLECQSREENVLNLMRRQAHQEKELDYEAWRTTQCKNIIIENRKLRETQYERRRTYDIEMGIEKEEKLITEMQEASTRELFQMLQRSAELKVYEQEQKLKQRTELCSELMGAIFDIADEAFNHMQDLDSKEWDSRNWGNWLKLFVHKQKISGAMADLLAPNTESEAHNQLDQCELEDYCKNQNQWPISLVSDSKISLADVMNPKIEAIAAPAKGKAPVGKAQVQADVIFEEGDLEVPEKPVNNHLFGNVIDQLIKLHYPQRPDLKHPPTPNWLALKICLIGYPFSGKKTQAQLIKEKYGLDVYVMEELIDEAIQFNGNKKYQNPAQPEQDNGSEYAGLSEDEILQKDVNVEMAEIGSLIKEQLLNGEEISDQLYVRLFICKLRTTYAYKCPITKKRELLAKAQRYSEINKRIGEIAQECSKDDLPKKQRKNFADEQAALEIELAEMDTIDKNGWVLVDFPCSYAQAKLLEEALSGYKPTEELSRTDRESEISDATLIVQPSALAETSDYLVPSGLDAVIWFDCPIEQCIRRSGDRRFDSLDSNVRYHIFNQLPPTDQAPLCERLLPLSEDNNSVQGLPDRFIAFDQNTTSMQRWFKQFGNENRNRQLITLLDASVDQNEVQDQITGTLNLILEQRQEHYLATRDQLALKIQTKREESKLQETLVHDKSNISINSKTNQSPLASKRNIDARRSEAQSITQLGEPQSPALKQTNYSRNNIELEFRPVLINLWQQLSRNYRGQMKKIFRNIRRFRESNFKQKAETQQKFLSFLNRQDNKQELLDQFVRDFNQFSDDFPDLREDPATKEELHQRCDVLSDELWEIVEERKEQNIEVRKQIMESGNVENGLEFLTLCAQQLMQAELDKFKISIQIIHDYYFAIEEKNTHEITGAVTSELAFEGEDMPAVETLPEGADASQIQNYSYPRLDKLLQLALKQQIVPDVTQTQSSANDKKGGAKAPPPKKGVVTKEAEVELQLEESKYVKEMREAVKIEKSILRFRLVQIRNWTIKRLHYTRQTGINLFKKFEDWILVSQKAGMDTIEEMCAVIKKAIEDEVKIQHELRIKFMDFTVDDTVLNYINPPIPKLEAIEEYREDRFQIPQLISFVDEFERISMTIGDLLHYRYLSTLLLNKVKNSIYFGGLESSVPESWNGFGLVQIHQMIRNTDPKCTGYVNWRILITYIILLQSQVPSAKEISRVEQVLKKNEVSLQEFVHCNFWFDKTEGSKDQENAIQFQRVLMVKELLFRVHQTNGVLNVSNFATLLGQISQRAVKPEETTFSDLLFASVKI